MSLHHVSIMINLHRILPKTKKEKDITWKAWAQIGERLKKRVW